MAIDCNASRVADQHQSSPASNFSRRGILRVGVAASLSLPFANGEGEAAGVGGLKPKDFVHSTTSAKEETTITFFPGFSAETIQTSGTTIHVLRKGTGRPLLLHDYPETHLTWHKVAPQLAEQYSVGVPDLRGYGDSGKPEGGDGTRTIHFALWRRTRSM